MSFIPVPESPGSLQAVVTLRLSLGLGTQLTSSGFSLGLGTTVSFPPLCPDSGCCQF